MAYPQYREDLSRVGASWWYVWGTCYEVDCVPMSYGGEDPNLSPSYDGYILLFNEPNNYPPYGQTITPVEAVPLFLSLEARYPNATWVVGNVSVWAGDWLVEFHSLLQGEHRIIWGMHGYIEGWLTPESLMQQWSAVHDELGGDFWITEWADTRGNISNVRILLQYFEATEWIKRHAYFTNRVQGTEEWYPQQWGDVSLFDYSTGNPTMVESAFVWPYITYLPVIIQ